MTTRPAGATPRRARSRSAVRRVTEVFDAFAASSSDLGVSELARHMRCSKSVVHRLLAGLAEAGYVTADPRTRRYRLGSKALLLGQSASAPDDLRRQALPHLEAIRERTGETATLSVLRGSVRIYVEQLESRERVRQTVVVGHEAPLHLGASGKAILAHLPTTSWPAAARGQVPEAELDQIRRLGYAVSRAERIAGATSTAAPVFDHTGSVIGSISAAGVLARFDPASVTKNGTIVAAAARSLSRKLGWRKRSAP